MYYSAVAIEEFIGKTFISVTKAGEQLDFECADGSRYSMYHEQDCCEHVYIESITGELEDLTGSPISIARESTNRDPHESRYGTDGSTWTFYTLATARGWVDIRWCGSSNGYYSESVCVRRTKEPT